MSSRRPPARRLSPNRSYSDDDDESPIADRRRSAPRRPSRGPRGPPDVPHTAQFTDRKRSARPRGYSLPGEKPRRGRLEITLRLCIFDQSSHGWRTSTLTFDAYKTNDREIWHDIRSIYRNELQGIWRRIFGFSKLKSILPIEYTKNDVPIRVKPEDFPDAHSFMHCFHHPSRIKTDHDWVDWFVDFDHASPNVLNGLEFKQGLWADKLALIAILLTVAIIIVSAVWCARGGNLQTVFTVMSFVLSGIAAEIALVALYFQLTMSN